MSLNPANEHGSNWQSFHCRVRDCLKDRGFTIDHDEAGFFVFSSKDGKSLNFSLSPYFYFDGDPEQIAADMEKHWQAKVA